MDSKYSNLRGKTIFDFTGDSEVLKEILGEGDYLDFMENPKEAIEESKHYTQFANVGMLVDYANLISDDKLYNALKKEYEDEYPQMFNKEDGFIID